MRTTLNTFRFKLLVIVNMEYFCHCNNYHLATSIMATYKGVPGVLEMKYVVYYVKFHFAALSSQ